MRPILLLLLFLFGCPDATPPGDDDDGTPGDDDDGTPGDDDSALPDDDDDDTTPLCDAGEAFCAGEVAMLCAGDGLTATVVEDCAPDRMCWGGECKEPCDVVASRRSYLGCDFLAVTTLNSGLGAGFANDFAVVVGAPAEGLDANVEVHRGGILQTTQQVAAGTSEAVVLPMVAALQQAGGGLLTNASSATVLGGAYEVHSDVPVVAYQFNPLHFSTSALSYSFTNDASLLLPEHALTGEYRALTWNSWPSSPFVQYRGFVAVAATEDGTTVTITPTCNTAPGTPGPVQPGQPQVVTLDRGDVVQVLSGSSEAEDLSGTTISATAPVATWAGHDCTYMPQGQAACDHLEEMSFPVETWGALIPVAALEHPDGVGPAPAMIRAMARTGGVQLSFEPPVHADVTLAADDLLEFQTDQDFVLTATGQVQLTQTMLGQDALAATSGGDPAMGTGIPWSQVRATYDFLVPTTYTTNWLNVVAPTGSSVVLDGTPLPAGTAVGTSGFEAQRVALGTGSHHVESADGTPFSITVYGYAQYTSYLLPAGLNLLR